MKSSAAFYSKPFDFAEESYEDEGANQKDANSLEKVNGLAQVSANEMDGNLSRNEHEHEIDGSSKVNGSYQTYAKSESGIVSNSTGTSTNTKLASVRIDSNFEARRTKLQDDIDENSLDECLATFERGPLYEYEKERISKLNLNSMTPTSSTDDEDNETPLLDKLSSLSLSAKNSVCQANDLLKKLSGKQIEYGKQEERVAMIDDSKRLDDKKEPDKTSSRVLDQEDEEDKETVFIDLRNDIRELRIKVGFMRSQIVTQPWDPELLLSNKAQALNANDTNCGFKCSCCVLNLTIEYGSQHFKIVWKRPPKSHLQFGNDKSYSYEIHPNFKFGF